MDSLHPGASRIILLQLALVIPAGRLRVRRGVRGCAPSCSSSPRPPAAAQPALVPAASLLIYLAAAHTPPRAHAQLELYAVCWLAEVSVTTTAYILANNAAMLGCGLLGAIATVTYVKVSLFLAAFLFCALIAGALWVVVRDTEHTFRHYEDFVGLLYFLAFTWGLFPVNLLLSPYMTSVISSDSYEVAQSLLDVVARTGFALVVFVKVELRTDRPVLLSLDKVTSAVDLYRKQVALLEEDIAWLNKSVSSSGSSGLSESTVPRGPLDVEATLAKFRDRRAGRYASSSAMTPAEGGVAQTLVRDLRPPLEHTPARTACQEQPRQGVAPAAAGQRTRGGRREPLQRTKSDVDRELAMITALINKYPSSRISDAGAPEINAPHPPPPPPPAHSTFPRPSAPAASL